VATNAEINLMIVTNALLIIPTTTIFLLPDDISSLNNKQQSR